MTPRTTSAGAPRITHRAGALLSPLIVLAVLVACGGSPAAQSSTQQHGGAPSAIKIGYSIIGAGTVYNWGGVDAGFFKKNKLSATLSYTASSTAVAALLSGEIDVAQVGGADVVNAYASGGSLVVVANLAPVHNYLLMVPKDVTKASQLKGAKVGISGPGTTSDVQTRIALQALGLNPDRDVALISTASQSNRVAALKSGALTAAAIPLTDALELEKSGFHALIDLAKRKLQAIDTVVAVNAGFVKSHRSAVQAYVDGLIQTIAYERAHKAWTEREITKYAKVTDQATLDATYQQMFSEVLTGDYPVPTAAQFTKDVGILEKTNPKLARVKVGSLIDASFVKSAQSRHVAGAGGGGGGN